MTYKMSLIIRRGLIVNGAIGFIIGNIIHGGNSENRFVKFYLHVFVHDVKFLRS